MTKEQIETLKKMLQGISANAQARKVAVDDFVNLGNQPAAEAHRRIYAKYEEEADTLRAAIALAEERVAIDGWVIGLAYRGDRYTIEKTDDYYTVDQSPELGSSYTFLNSTGVWSEYARDRAKFPTFAAAIAAANKAIGGQP